LETLFGVIIVLLILGLCFFLMYWGFRPIYKTILKSKSSSDVELTKELNSLKQRVELLERKLDNR
jgi:amino acid permease